MNKNFPVAPALLSNLARGKARDVTRDRDDATGDLSKHRRLVKLIKTGKEIKRQQEIRRARTAAPYRLRELDGTLHLARTREDNDGLKLRHADVELWRPKKSRSRFAFFQFRNTVSV